MLDTALLSELQYALIEPPDGGLTWPGEVWTRDEVLDGLNGSIRSLVRDTQLLVTRTAIPVAAGTRSIDLPASWLMTAWLAWRDSATLVRTPLGPVDAFEGDLALPGWEAAPGSPLAYADLDLATLTLRLVPTPAADGVLECLYIPRPAEVTGTGSPLPLAEEFLSGVKYATLGWLLRKVGRLHDQERATYCEQRYQLTQLASEILLGGWA